LKFYNLYDKSHLYASLVGMSSDADLYVYDQSGNYLASSTSGGNASEMINVDLPGNQYSYVRVHAYSGATNYGCDRRQRHPRLSLRCGRRAADRSESGPACDETG
jgi:hypothetical protein